MNIHNELIDIFYIIRNTLIDYYASPELIGNTNPKGDKTYKFDYLSDNLIIEECKKKFSFPICILSEESGKQYTKEGPPLQQWIIDPVDGSVNFSRGLFPSGFAIAILPYDLPICSDNVQIAFLGNLINGDYYFAENGKGVIDDKGNNIEVSQNRELTDALIGCDLNFKEHPFDQRIIQLMNNCKDIRRMGSTVSELMHCASGKYDGYVDVRNELTCEDFLAASLIIREAGGVITDIKGDDWGEIKNLTDEYTIITAANIDLHKKILEIFN